jgi:hypothetical protein
MSDVVACISRLVKSARRLRAAADELGQLDLKSEIVDEITTLQEIREELADDSHLTETEIAVPSAAAAAPAAASPGADSDSSTLTVAAMDDAPMGVVKPTGKEETYSLNPEEEAEEVETASASAAPTEDSESDSRSDGPKGPSVDERRAVIEMRMADLEQLEQDATRRLNDVPSAEQKKIKVKANHAGREAGKAGKELQQFVYGAMKLTHDQKVEIQAVRKDLASLREAIAKEQASLERLDAPES